MGNGGEFFDRNYRLGGEKGEEDEGSLCGGKRNKDRLRTLDWGCFTWTDHGVRGGRGGYSATPLLILRSGKEEDWPGGPTWCRTWSPGTESHEKVKARRKKPGPSR